MSLDQNFPSPAAPFVGPDGRLTDNALSLLRVLWDRTGYAPGVSSDDLALLSVLSQAGADTDTTARDEASGAFLTALQGSAVSIDPSAHEQAEAAFLGALQAMRAPQGDDDDAKLFALSLLGPIYALISSGGSGSVTSIEAGDGITVTPDPIVATGTVALDADVLPAFGYWSPLTNGNTINPELIFDASGDTIAVWTAL